MACTDLKGMLQICPGSHFKQALAVKIPETPPEGFFAELLAKHMKNHRTFVITDSLADRIIAALKLFQGKILVGRNQSGIVSQNLQPILAGIFSGFFFPVKIIRHIGR